MDDRTDEEPGDLSKPTVEGLCPKCGAEVWDNTINRTAGDKRPLYKCKNDECDWRKWQARPRTGGDAARANTKKSRLATGRF